MFVFIYQEPEPEDTLLRCMLGMVLWRIGLLRREVLYVCMCVCRLTIGWYRLYIAVR